MQLRLCTYPVLYTPFAIYSPFVPHCERELILNPSIQLEILIKQYQSKTITTELASTLNIDYIHKSISVVEIIFSQLANFPRIYLLENC